MEHIGKTLKRIIKEKNISAEELGKLIGRSNPAVYRMFRKEHLHLKLLEKISLAIGHDMFQYLSQPAETTSEEKQKIISLQKENDELKKEIIFLREVILALKKK